MYSMPSAQNLQTLRRRKKTFLRTVHVPPITVTIEAPVAIAIEAAPVAVVAAPLRRGLVRALAGALAVTQRAGDPHRLGGRHRALALAHGAAQVLVGADPEIAQHAL